MAGELPKLVADEIQARSGILRLDPAWVARDWLPPGRRLGLPAEEYDLGERGYVCERWLASTTKADNVVGPDDEGISSIRTTGGARINLAEAVAACGDLILGSDYSTTHAGLGRLAKIFDYAVRIPLHIHPPLEFARRAGRNSKDEAYYFPPGVDMGPHPESFLGVHPSLHRDRLWGELVDAVREWNDDRVLRHSPAYVQVPEEGFFIPSGVLHAPGTALTIELQEDSDSMAMFQALNAGAIISKRLLTKDVSEADLAEHGETAPLHWIDWDANTDPSFYDNHRLVPLPLRDEPAASEVWIFYGSPKFCGKRLTLEPGARYGSRENGVFSLFVWRGVGTIGGVDVIGESHDRDELLVVHDRAVDELEYVNTGTEPLVVLKMFGPDLCPDAPSLPRRRF
ncbi:hypothetical protein ACPW96_01240 [Micromonospora sp. DT81.3]|uniref:hypothetical protein n=1 Tax=Micromonospora sp. DT81.3 TaxID=3416523 RepID=UPI003CF28ECB